MLLLLLMACSRDELVAPELPETSVLTVRKNWVVVSEPYLPLYDQPDINGDVSWFSRMGEVFEVDEQSLETGELQNTEDYWYRIHHERGNGWAFGGALDFYGSREEALNASTRMTGDTGF